MTTPAAQLRRWRQGSEGFFRFLEEVQPRIRSSAGGFIPYAPEPRERAEIARAIDGAFSTIVFCWPRRHGKTVAMAMIAIWRFLTKRNENVAIVANSETQVVDTAFKILLDAFDETPALRSLKDKGHVAVTATRIERPATAGVIQAYSANAKALWGKKITAAQVSELHAARSEEVLEALSGSLIDSAGSMLLIDSTVGPRSSPLFGLYNLAKSGDDPALFFSHLQYADVEDAIANGPAWINATHLRSISKTMLPHRFGMFHLNRWQDASDALFSSDMLARAVGEYPLTLPKLTLGAACVVGAGVDRAFGGSQHNDATVTCAVAKVLVGEDEHFYVLDCADIPLSLLSGIKNQLTGYHRAHGMKRLAIEAYNAQDVRDWAMSQPFADGTETIHPTRNSKFGAFTSLYAIAAEGRLHIHPTFAKLLDELATLEMSDTSSGGQAAESIPTFHHAKGAHDDAAHALVWAVYSLRESTLSPYELAGVDCNGAAAVAPLCALNGGYLIPPCAETCRSMQQAHKLFRGYLARGPLIPVGFPEFVIEKLHNTGAHVSPRK